MENDPRTALIEVCHLLAARNFTTATGGNVSVRLPDDSCWVTPSGLHKGRVTREDLVRIDRAGTILEGARKPSSETVMHLTAYQSLPQAQAIIHAHPPYATGFTQAGKTLDTSSSSEAIAILGPDVPLLPYAPPSSAELAALVGRSVRPLRKAYMLAHHGVLTWGTDLWDAYDILDTMELFAQSLAVAILAGGAVSLPAHEQEWLARKHQEIMGGTGA